MVQTPGALKICIQNAKLRSLHDIAPPIVFGSLSLSRTDLTKHSEDDGKTLKDPEAPLDSLMRRQETMPVKTAIAGSLTLILRTYFFFAWVKFLVRILSRLLSFTNLSFCRFARRYYQLPHAVYRCCPPHQQRMTLQCSRALSRRGAAVCSLISDDFVPSEQSERQEKSDGV